MTRTFEQFDDQIEKIERKKTYHKDDRAYIDDDELVEVTPKSIRLRKRLLNPHERKKAERQRDAIEVA